MIRSNGIHTYFAADCAYVIDKFARGFDHLIYVWGADHHGDIVRVKGAAQALGYDPDAAEIVLYQWVAFLRDGTPVAMSKRAGNFVSLDQLIDEVGTDAARFTLLQFSNDSTVNFDIEVVKQQTMENPVYYVQYGHARIASILRKAESQGVALKAIADVDLSLLTHDSELDLLRALAEVPAKLAIAAEQRGPHRLTHASQDLAAKFHRFYAECRVVSDDEALTQARLWLASGTKQVIANLLGLARRVGARGHGPGRWLSGRGRSGPTPRRQTSPPPPFRTRGPRTRRSGQTACGSRGRAPWRWPNASARRCWCSIDGTWSPGSARRGARSRRRSTP